MPTARLAGKSEARAAVATAGKRLSQTAPHVGRELDHVSGKPGSLAEGEAPSEIDELRDREAQAYAQGRPDEAEETALEHDEGEDAPLGRAEGAERAPLAHALEDDPVHRVAEDEQRDEEDDQADDRQKAAEHGVHLIEVRGEVPPAAVRQAVRKPGYEGLRAAGVLQDHVEHGGLGYAREVHGRRVIGEGEELVPAGVAVDRGYREVAAVEAFPRAGCPSG